MQKPTYSIGDAVDTDTHGSGRVSGYSTKDTALGKEIVYAVALDSGDTRHFTEEQLS